MDAVEVIRTKRDGFRLADEQIRWFLDAYANGDEVADEQAAALAMAIYWRGMEPDELAVWTDAMIASGSRLELRGIGRPTVDKHSTGGVGDKVSLIVVPILAACGAAVPQLSGRGLGHTGGTLDKMEAIPGWSPQLDVEAMLRQLADHGGVIAGATEDLVPADRKLYALRDITGTIESIPLIASSIMSKKIAEGADSLVLDVKVGRGAFMPDIESARALAETMVTLGDAHGVRTVALLTGMDTVLGQAAGNGVEVTEALEVLDGRGPEDLIEVSLALADEMAALAGVTIEPRWALESGAGRQAFHDIVKAQGGRLDEGVPVAAHRTVVPASAKGFVGVLDALAVGKVVWHLGAGRAQKEDPVSPTAGVLCLAKPGEAVEVGQPLFEVHADDPEHGAQAEAELRDAYTIVDEPPSVPPLILERIAR